MRRTYWILSAAVGEASSASAQPPSSSSSSTAAPASPSPAADKSTSSAAPRTPSTGGGGGGKGGEKGEKGVASPAMAFRLLPLRAWQMQCIQTTTAAATLFDKAARLPSSGVLYYGERLGPRPLVILDASLPMSAGSSQRRQQQQPASPPPAAAAAAAGAGANADAATLTDELRASDAALQSAAKFEGILSHLQWPHGAVYIPLHVDVPSSSSSAGTHGSTSNANSSQYHNHSNNQDAAAAAAADSSSSSSSSVLLQRSCGEVLAVLDALGVRWSHFLTYSYGTLVAAFMATAAATATAGAVPGACTRVGSLLSLDTPLITAAMVRNAATRADLAAASADVNIPASELAFAREMLKEELEAPLPCPAAVLHAAATTTTAEVNDDVVYHGHLFDPAAIFADDGAVRDESRYVPVRALAGLRHPLQLIVPAKKGVADVDAHKHFFNLRRPAVIKSAADHAGLFSLSPAPAADAAGTAKGKAEGGGADAAVEVAAVVSAWLTRFEQDVVLARRYEAAAKEMSQLMGSTSATGGEAAGGGAGEGGKKKSKKEKKEKKKKG